MNTWLIDELQLIVERNHNALLHPGWSNTFDLADTSESFGTVPIHSHELQTAVNAIELDMSKIKLTPDQLFLCKMTGTKLPFLPVIGVSELKMFCQ